MPSGALRKQRRSSQQHGPHADGKGISREFFDKEISGGHTQSLVGKWFPDWDEDKVEEFSQRKEKRFRELADGGASPLPPHCNLPHSVPACARPPPRCVPAGTRCAAQPVQTHTSGDARPVDALGCIRRHAVPVMRTGAPVLLRHREAR